MGAAAEAETLSGLNLDAWSSEWFQFSWDPESPCPLQWVTTAQEAFWVKPEGQR